MTTMPEPLSAEALDALAAQYATLPPVPWNWNESYPHFTLCDANGEIILVASEDEIQFHCHELKDIIEQLPQTVAALLATVRALQTQARSTQPARTWTPVPVSEYMVREGLTDLEVRQSIEAGVIWTLWLAGKEFVWAEK